MTAARYLVGDVFDRLAELPDGSVDLVMTSPPFLALRSYLPNDHPDKGKEIGSEATPADFIDTLLDLSAEWRRVLAPHGSICVELGDTYSGSGGAGGDYAEGGLRDGQERFNGSAKQRRTSGDFPVRDDNPRPSRHIRKQSGWPLEKSLTGIPTLYAWSLAYGRNLLSGEESPAGMWRIRNLVVWCRPNPPVGALGDKMRPATSYLTVATIARDRWFDLDAVRTPASSSDHHARYPQTKYVDTGKDWNAARADGGKITGSNHPAGAPPLDYWEVVPGGYSGAHYAVMPAELCRRPIESMCPRRVCLTCGAPSRRITGGVTLDAYRGSDRPQTIRAVELADAAGLTDSHIAAIRATGPNDTGKALHINSGAGKNSAEVTRLATDAKAALGGYFREFVTTGNASSTTTGWTTCGCPGAEGLRLDGFHTGGGWRPGVVLDPFAGSGTTLMVASGLSRESIGMDIDSRNAVLARERLGMFLEVEEPDRVA